MKGVFDIGSPPAVFAAVAAGAAIKYVAGALLRKPKQYRMAGRVGEIWIFPVKSLRGISVQEANVGRIGLEVNGIGDRQWVVTNTNGNFLCQRRCPAMALIQPVVCGNEIELQAPGMDPIRFPANPELNSSAISKAIVFGKHIASMDLGDEVGDWLSRCLKIKGLRLHFAESSLEKWDASNDKKDWGNPAVKGDLIAYADFCGYMILSDGSVNFLNTHLKKPVPATNFRPNIIAGDCEAFAEDFWSSVRIGDSQLRALDACTRCVMPTVDQKRGVKDEDGEPLATLKKIRLKEPYGKSPIFGVNFTFEKPGTIRVGDPIYAIEA